MKFYAYKGLAPLGTEPCGTDGKMLFELKTIRGAILRCYKTWRGPCMLFTYTNFYDNKTFRRISTADPRRYR